MQSKYYKLNQRSYNCRQIFLNSREIEGTTEATTTVDRTVGRATREEAKTNILDSTGADNLLIATAQSTDFLSDNYGFHPSNPMAVELSS